MAYAIATALLLAGSAAAQGAFSFPSLTCDGCKSTLHTLDTVSLNNSATALIGLCEGSGVYPDVCQGIADDLLPSLKYALSKASIINATASNNVTDADWICPIIAGQCDFPNTTLPNVMTISSASNPRTALASTVNTADTYTVLHLSDLHIDPDYQAGTAAVCAYPMCCRQGTNVLPTNMTGVTPRNASTWGDYNCDVSQKLAENLLSSIASVVQTNLNKTIDFSIFTGDLPPHNVWETNTTVTNEASSLAFQLMKKYITNPLFPALGNHEATPYVNLIVPTSVTDAPISSGPLYEFLQSEWAQFLPTNSQIDIASTQGAYSIGYQQNFRIIAINTVMCYIDNFYTLYDQGQYDKGSQLAFLDTELAQAESKGEYVWIISHVAPGDADCGQNWSNMYSQIVERYQNTISAQFYGHSHRDEFTVFYPDAVPTSSSTPFSFGLLAPSQTTYTDLNPGFRVYSIDKTTYQIVDSYTFITNASTFVELDQNGGSPEYTLEYSARSYMPSWPAEAPLNANFWSSLINDIADSDDLFQQYMYYRGKSAGLDSTDCVGDPECRSDIICDLRAGNSASACVKPTLFKRDLQSSGRFLKPHLWRKELCSSHTHLLKYATHGH